MPGGQKVKRALVDKTSLLVVVITNLNPSYTELSGNWVVQIGATQTANIGDLYTPINAPITVSNTLSGGTFAPPVPVYPPLADSIANGIAAVNALADEKVTSAVGITSVSTGFISSINWGNLRVKQATSQPLTPQEQALLDDLNAKSTAADPIIAAQIALIGYLNALTDPATAAAFDAANPPDGLGWPA
jgi:hypothetical protein